MAVVARIEERPWLDELNEEQRAAATHAGGPLLILAGAGTGKTTTLCARVAWLVSEGVPSERILLLTFTRRASREMLQRARGLVPASSRVLGGTFHSVAHRLVRRHASALGPAGRVRRARRRRRGGRARPAARRARARAGQDAVPAQGHAAGHLLAHGQRAGAAVGRDRRALPVVFGPSRGDLGAVQGLHRAQAGARRDRPRRPAALLARARRRRGDRAAAGGVVRPRARRRVPGRQRPAGGHRALARRLRPGDHRGRRRLPGHLRLPLGLGGAHPRLPGALRRARTW